MRSNIRRLFENNLESLMKFHFFSGTWTVNAHEAGHIFGAEHSFENGQGTTGGIMDYGDGKYNGVYQFNPLR